MVSAIDRAKRLLVSLLKKVATTYGVVLQLSRESSDVDLRSAFKKVSRKAHPDQGGSVADQTALNTARDNWQDAVQQAAGKHGGDPKKKSPAPSGGPLATTVATTTRQDAAKKCLRAIASQLWCPAKNLRKQACELKLYFFVVLVPIPQAWNICFLFRFPAPKPRIAVLKVP
jgi:hypothetical protein